MRKMVFLIVTLMLFSMSWATNVYANCPMLSEKVIVQDKYQQNVEKVKHLYNAINNNKQAKLELEKEMTELEFLSIEFEKYIDSKVENSLSNFQDPVIRHDLREKYIDEFIEYAIDNGMITDINPETKGVTKTFLRGQFYTASLEMQAVGLKYTALCLRHSLNDNPSAMHYDYGSELSNIIKNTSVFQNKINSFKAKLTSVTGNYYYESGSFPLTKQNSSTDMYLALHNVDYEFAAEKINSRWKVYVVIKDTYNFEYWNYGGSVPQKVVTIINNYAAAAQKQGAIVPYRINISIRS